MISISETLAYGYEITKRNFGFLFLATLASFGISFVVIMGLGIVAAIFRMDDSNVAFNILVNIVFWPSCLGVFLGYIKIIIDILDGEKPEIADLV